MIKTLPFSLIISSSFKYSFLFSGMVGSSSLKSGASSATSNETGQTHSEAVDPQQERPNPAFSNGNKVEDHPQPIINHPITKLSQPLGEVGELSYREITIKIFTEKSSSPPRFFFEPIVILDGAKNNNSPGLPGSSSNPSPYWIPSPSSFSPKTCSKKTSSASPSKCGTKKSVPKYCNSSVSTIRRSKRRTSESCLTRRSSWSSNRRASTSLSKLWKKRYLINE